LKGKVTKIGGLEEKLQGAKHAGVKLALVPKGNEKDLIKIKERNKDLIGRDFKVQIVEKFSDVLKHALV
jgi:ATP-dependent Lon protease